MTAAIDHRTTTARGLRLALLAVACTPYVLLKLLWLAGVPLGVRDTGLMDSTTYRVANATTLLMDLVLVLVVVVLSGPRGDGRLGRLLLPPSVLGLGLLLPVVVAAPTIALAAGPDSNADDGLAGWVYAVVYTGFILQFLLLLTAAWPHLVRRTAASRRSPTGLTRTAALLGLLAGTAYVVALAARIGVGAELPRSTALLYGVLAFLTVVAGVLVVLRPGPSSGALALVVANSVWLWAGFSLLTSVAVPAGEPGWSVGGWLVGVLAGVCGVLALAPDWRGNRPLDPPAPAPSL